MRSSQKISLLIVVGVALLAWGLSSLAGRRVETSSLTEEGKLMIKKVEKTDEEWKALLTPEQFRVLRRKGTERAFTGIYNDRYEPGLYVCAACGNPLFSSETKYDHGTGWPSFADAVRPGAVTFHEDSSFMMNRTEVRCAACGSHLGHVFDDGPPPTGRRYCINSVALDFKSAGADKDAVPAGKTETAIFAAGCFWGVEDKFRRVPGVLSTEVGYTGGRTKNPTYKQVCSNTTGHAEAVRLVFDPGRVSYEDLVRLFFKLHDPTQLNRQGPDVGTQYRSAVFALDKAQEETAQRVKSELDRSGAFGRPIVTEIVPAAEFYLAEEYHQQYFEKRRRRDGGNPDECGGDACGR
ncbi:MAG: bifunctional methionine sulfoxide reductase B/A protein [Candidatus Aminicenantes bacterium]|nr:bifunctional methionine sulfoxide reductase B/A protein [Candidatus Aminicenantes bacterium]